MSTNPAQPGIFRSAIVLGLICVTGPFAIDMYLPALPAIEAALDTTVSGAQTTLIFYFVAFGLAQLVYGPLSDQIGRKRALFTGMSIFIAGALGCAAAQSIEMLAASRFVQGLGGAAVMVIPRAIIRDMHTGPQATRLMAAMMLVISISPMLAPLAGSAVIAFGSWREIFLILAGVAGLSMLMASLQLGETLLPAARRKVDVRSLTRNSGVLVRDPVFMGLTFIGGLSMASFFSFIASASFVYTDQYGMTPTEFSLAFAFNAVGFFAASQMAGPLADRIGVPKLIRYAVTGFASFAVLLLAIFALGLGSLPVLIAGLFLAFACLGCVMPTTMVAALDAHGMRAGIASSLGGTLQMMAAGSAIAISGLWFDGTALPMVVTIALCACGALALTLVTMPRLRAQQVAMAAAAE